MNSVCGEEARLERVLPLVKQYGAAVIGLAQDDEGIPKNAERRVAVAHKIVESRRENAASPEEDIIIDVMAYAIGAEPKSGKDVLKALRQIRDRAGTEHDDGVSNISFGMPDRALLNSAWVAMVIDAGATALIADAAKVLPAVLSADLVLGRDRFARRYHRRHSASARQQARPRLDTRSDRRLYLKIAQRGVEQWQLVGLITRRSLVQIQPPLPIFEAKIPRNHKKVSGDFSFLLTDC